MIVVEPKMTQPVESDKELIGLFISTSRNVQKPSLSSRTLVQLDKVEPQPVKVEPQPVKVEPQPVEVQSKFGQRAIKV